MIKKPATRSDAVNLSLLRRVNLNHLVSFLAIADTQSFRGAAGLLHMSQSALSVQLLQLEETLGVPLFHRTTRSVTLTDQGERLLPVARLVAHEVAVVAAEFREEVALRRGVATVAAIATTVSWLMPSVIKAVGDAYPGIKVQILVMESADVAEKIRQGEADIGLLSFSQDQNQKDLAYTKLYDENFIAVVPESETEFVGMDSVTLQQLSKFEFMIQPEGSTIRRLVDRRLKEQGVTVKVRQELLLPEGLVALVRQGLGVTMLPAYVIAPLDLRGCRAINMRGVRPREIGLVMSERRSVSPAAASVRAFILDTARATPEAGSSSGI